MKKVLQISKYYYPFRGGTEQVARDITSALKKLDDVEQKIICFNEDASDGDYVCKRNETVYDNVDGIDVIRCGCQTKISSQSISWSYKKELYKVLDEFKPDLVILHYPNPFVTHFLLEYHKYEFKLCVYWHLDITKQKFLKPLFSRQNKKLLAKATRVIATSPNYVEGSQWLQSARDKCVVIPNCIDEERMRITADIEKRAHQIREENKGKTICVSVGRHTEYKGFSYLIKTSELLDDSFRFFITGTGELTEELHKEAEGNKRIIFTGRIDDSELKAYLLASDIFCFPSISKNEAFGIALAEAMYYRKPAATFTIPGSGVNYVCLNGEDGIEVPNKNFEAYAEALNKLASDAEMREKYGNNAYMRVCNNFISDIFYDNIINIVAGLEIKNGKDNY